MSFSKMNHYRIYKTLCFCFILLVIDFVVIATNSREETSNLQNITFSNINL
jgi:hypothetical protein